MKTDTEKLTSTLGSLFYMAIWAVGLYGYLANIIWLLDTDAGLTAHVVVRLIGIIMPPLGALLGLFA